MKPFQKLSAFSLAGSLLFTSGLATIPAVQAETAAFTDSMVIEKIAGYDTGLTDEDGGVAEIVKYNTENQKFYVINGKNQTIDIVSLANLTSEKGQELTKEKSINIGDAVNDADFTYGDLTSIDVNVKKDIVVATIQDENYLENGKIVVMDYDGAILDTYETGVQPDMVKISADGRYIFSADEGEPRAGLENGTDPDGSVTIVDLEADKTTVVKFDNASVIKDDVHLRNKDAAKDLEPEYIALSNDGKKAYVALQENNAIATIDVVKATVESVKSLGFKDHSLPGNELDAKRNGEIEFKNLPILGVYMPDSVAFVSIGGVDYLVTANEGDATEWEEFVNIADFEDYKDNITINPDLFKGMNAEEAQAAFTEMKNNPDFEKLEVLTDRGNDAVYTLGGRSFTIWKADTMELVYDSGSDFEKITADRYPEVFNWSNDDNEMDKRSAKKGPEPEDVKVGMIGDEIYAFVGLERISGFMTYNISNPQDASFVNYLNSRDFSTNEAIAGDVAPEGLDFVSAEVSPTGRPLIIVGNEVSGTVAVNEVQVDPYIAIDNVTLDQTAVALEAGKTVQLTATITPENTSENKELVWSSSDEKVATVSANGLVTAVSEGTTTITVQTLDGKHRAETQITVTKPAPPTNNDSDENKPDPNNNNENTNNDNKNTNNSQGNQQSNNNIGNTSANHELPDTATINYQILLLGFFVLAAGGTLFIIVKRKALNLK
ncbi:Ig-like domain-containing protein [Bacillaceae bacterium Marseille-Q3522]|nr:Ig-like domain-containing protein [Bacillaceae bacterium Marseille-Q3522]